MLLNKNNLYKISVTDNVSIPKNDEFKLPEKVLQFGTGVLLRGLPDYYICKANRQKVFNGRVIAVKSTCIGDVTAFAKQDNLFLHSFKNINENKTLENIFINAAISRVLTAKNEWHKILECAAKPELKIIISNTTEAGIVLDKTDRIDFNPPKSFPCKLLSFLRQRYKIFEGSFESGMVIIPTELIVDNGSKLKNVLVELATINQLENNFIDWLITANDFCNSLVDRIVTALKNQEIICNDSLSIESESYGLWAIETTSVNTKNLLSFASVNSDVIITEDIKKFRQLKIGLLNATHSFSCALALLYHFNYVNETIQNIFFRNFLKQLMHHEIVPCIISNNISADEANAFAETVLSRFLNPYLQHKWSSIALQYKEKINERCLPLIIKHYEISSDPPQKMALGLAAYLVYIKADIKQTFSDKKIWNINVRTLPGFTETVILYVNKIKQGIALSALIQLHDVISNEINK